MIAKGGSMAKMMAENMGKATGICKGKGGSMHIADFSIGELGANGIIGAGWPLGIGAALASKQEAKERYVLPSLEMVQLSKVHSMKLQTWLPFGSFQLYS